MENEFKKANKIAIKHSIFKLFIPENNFEKINGTFRNIEDRVGQVTTKRQLIRKSYFISVELIENVMKYGIFNTVFENNFLMAYDNSTFYFSSGNLVNSRDISFISRKLDEINTAFDKENSKDLLKEMYKDKLSEIGIADTDVKIGIIELARRLDNKILYNFKKVSDAHSAFSIICTVDDK